VQSTAEITAICRYCWYSQSLRFRVRSGRASSSTPCPLEPPDQLPAGTSL